VAQPGCGFPNAAEINVGSYVGRLLQEPQLRLLLRIMPSPPSLRRNRSSAVAVFAIGPYSRTSPRNKDAFLVNIKPDIGDTIHHDPSPMYEARHRFRRNPRYLHTVRGVAQYIWSNLMRSLCGDPYRVRFSDRRQTFLMASQISSE